MHRFNDFPSPNNPRHFADLYNSDPLGDPYQRKVSRARRVLAQPQSVKSIVRQLQPTALPYQLDLSLKHHLEKDAVRQADEARKAQRELGRTSPEKKYNRTCPSLFNA